MLKYVKFEGFAKGRSDDGFSAKNNPFSHNITELMEEKIDKLEEFIEIVTRGKFGISIFKKYTKYT